MKSALIVAALFLSSSVQAQTIDKKLVWEEFYKLTASTTCKTAIDAINTPSASRSDSQALINALAFAIMEGAISRDSIQRSNILVECSVNPNKLFIEAVKDVQ